MSPQTHFPQAVPANMPSRPCTRVATALVTLATALPLVFGGGAALAQSRTGNAYNTPVYSQATGALRVDSFGVRQLNQVGAGSELMFTLYGTPGATATLQIAGATDALQLQEIQSGVYTGAYTVRSRDRISAGSAVTASLSRNGQTVQAQLAQSLVMGAAAPLGTVGNAVGVVGSGNAVAASTARIDAFEVTADQPLADASTLRFSLTGAPGGQASVAVPGVQRSIPLREVRSGVYEGRYELKRRDRLDPNTSAVATLTVAGRQNTQPFLLSATERMGRADRLGRGERNGLQPVAQQTCATCGQIETVREVQAEGRSNVLGTLLGGVAGGVVGNQVGGGSGRDIATVLGAVGGAYAGNRIQNSRAAANAYEVVVRLDNGSSQTFTYAQPPTVGVGTRVKVENNALILL